MCYNCHYQFSGDKWMIDGWNHCMNAECWPPCSYLLHAAGPSCLAAGMPGGGYGEFGGVTPGLTSLNASFSTSMSIPSPYLFVPPAERKAISDVRRTFCLFVTFDLLFISLLWIIELNVSALVLVFLLRSLPLAFQWSERRHCAINKSSQHLISTYISDIM